MDIATKNEAGAVVVAVKGKINAVTAAELEAGLAEPLGAEQSKLILNLSEVDYISSAGLRVILSAAKKMKARQGDLLLADLQGPVEDVMKISGFYSILKVFDSEEDALAQA